MPDHRSFRSAQGKGLCSQVSLAIVLQQPVSSIIVVERPESALSSVVVIGQTCLRVGQFGLRRLLRDMSIVTTCSALFLYLFVLGCVPLPSFHTTATVTFVVLFCVLNFQAFSQAWCSRIEPEKKNKKKLSCFVHIACKVIPSMLEKKKKVHHRDILGYLWG